MITITFDAVKSAEQMSAENKQDQPEAKPSGIGGMFGGLAERVKKPSADDRKPRTTVMTSTVEVLKLSTDVADADVAIPSGCKENR